MSELDFGKVPEGTFVDVMSYMALGVIGAGLAALFVYHIIKPCLEQLYDNYREYQEPPGGRAERNTAMTPTTP